jgi:hypothetical protein
MVHESDNIYSEVLAKLSEIEKKAARSIADNPYRLY